MIDPRTRSALLFLGLGIVSGSFVAAIAIASLAGGHGWRSGIFLISALLTSPAGAVVWALRSLPGIARLAIGLTIVNLVIAAAIVVSLIREGTEGFFELWDHAAPVVAGVLSVWLVWQILPMLTLRRPR